jgi:hypothetical protein
LDAATKRRDEITFEELPNVVLTWMERLQLAIQDSGKKFLNSYPFDLEIFRIDETRDWVSLLFGHPIFPDVDLIFGGRSLCLKSFEGSDTQVKKVSVCFTFHVGWGTF